MKLSLGWRINLLIAFLLLSLIALSPKFGAEGVEIDGVSGRAREVGITEGEVIKSINNVEINNPVEYAEAISSYLGLEPVNISIVAKKISFNNESNKSVEEGVRVEYEALNSLLFDVDNITVRNSRVDGLENGMILEEVNGVIIREAKDFEDIRYELLNTKKVEILTDKNRHIFLVAGDPGIDIKDVSKSNVEKGLDLEGGTRVLLKPKEKVSEKELQDLISVLRNKLDVYGLRDLRLRAASSGEDRFILIEVAGIGRGDIEDFVAKQGKFEAKIGNTTVFEGGKKDIPFVCKDDGTCAGVRGCGELDGGGYNCRFEFSISLSPETAKRHADVTRNLDIVGGQGVNAYLSEQIDFFLDDKLIDSLNIASSLRGVEATQILISGPGFGNNKDAALKNALAEMEKLQTVLITGSLPVELEIVEINSISPLLGKEFVRNAFKVALFAILAVLVVVFIRYRNFKIILPMAITLISEIAIILGIAAFIKWRLDLASIAGIIASVGTGVDDQIVIADEVIKGKKEVYFSWKEKIKKAFFIIIVAYFSTVVAMLPLWSAGAGLFRGFALTTIIGVSVGVFVTRPAFAVMLEKLVK